MLLQTKNFHKPRTLISQTLKISTFKGLSAPKQIPPFSPSSHLTLDPKHLKLCSITTKLIFCYRSEDSFINMRKDYYDILEIDENSSFQEIKQKFYLLAKKYHPDKTSGDESVFKEINEAYNILSQPHLKEEYDQNRTHSQQNAEQKSTKVGNDKTLNYEAYSQMSKLQWAYHRQGVMRQTQVDYTNYFETFDPQKNETFDFKQTQQWHRAYMDIQSHHITEENQFRQKVCKKFQQDMKSHKEARQSYYDAKFDLVGAQIEIFFGKRFRNFFNKLISR